MLRRKVHVVCLLPCPGLFAAFHCATSSAPLAMHVHYLKPHAHSHFHSPTCTHLHAQFLQVDEADIAAFAAKLLQELSLLVDAAVAAQQDDVEGLCQLCERDMPLTKHHLIPRCVCWLVSTCSCLSGLYASHLFVVCTFAGL